MDINEVRMARRALEAHIQTAVSEKVEAFKDLTGLAPASISIDMIDITTFADTERQTAVGDVTVDVRL